MKKNLKRIMVLIMTLALSLTSLGNSVAYAQEDKSVLKLDKSNITYIKGEPGDTNLIYTYTSDNKTFKVIENSSVNFDDVDSIIYVENSDGQFVEYATQKLTVEDDVIYITINENGLITTDIININQEKTSDIENLPYQSNSNFNSISSKTGPMYYEFPVDETWYYLTTTEGSSDVTRYTLTAVIAVLGAIAAGALGFTGGVVTAGISSVAMVIVQDNIERIWWTNYHFYQCILRDEDWQVPIKVAEKVITYVYSSSTKSERNKIDEYSVTSYAEGYVF